MLSAGTRWNKRRSWRCAWALCLLLASACQQEMARQPSYRPLEPSEFFADGRSARPLIPGTVARGHFRDDLPLYTGQDTGRRQAALAASLPGLGITGPLTGVALAAMLPEARILADYTDVFPLPLTTEVLERGQQRYTIFCAVCHDPAGTGHGKIVERGYTRPPNYSTDLSRGFQRRGIRLLLRDAPVGYYFEVITRGYGAMPDYAEQVPPRDRWAIIAYIRALQLSQYARLSDLPAKERQAALNALEAQRERGNQPSR